MSVKTYLIIGGTHGIGLATAKRIADVGHRVWVCGRSQPEIHGNTSLQFFALDVRSTGLDFDAAPDFLDGIAYCPGSINLKPFRNLSETDFRGDWELNFLDAVRCIKALLPRLENAKPASIVLFSTVAAQQGMPFHASISAAKGAVEAFTRSLAAELAPHVRVNCVAPSLTDTRLAERLLPNDKRRKEASGRHPLARYGLPEDIASVVALLLSDSANWMTGQVVGVDGGLSTLRI